MEYGTDDTCYLIAGDANNDAELAHVLAKEIARGHSDQSIGRRVKPNKMQGDEDEPYRKGERRTAGTADNVKAIFMLKIRDRGNTSTTPAEIDIWDERLRSWRNKKKRDASQM